MTLGARLKDIRESKSYTLKQTAELSGLSIGFISQVERGQTDPSLSSLKKLAMALNIKLKDLFDLDPASHLMVRKGEGSILQIEPGVRCELLASSPSKMMESFIKYIVPGAQSGVIGAHAGEEFLLLLAGSLRLTLESGDYLLHTGDSMCFQANQEHSWQNTGAEECRVLWTMSPPGYT